MSVFKKLQIHFVIILLITGGNSEKIIDYLIELEEIKNGLIKYD